MQIPLNKNILRIKPTFWCTNTRRSFPREQNFVAWLDEVKRCRSHFLGRFIRFFGLNIKPLFLKVYCVFLGKLPEIRDSGIGFLANHDLWMHDYFQKELNIVYHNNKNILCWKKLFLIGHGDGKVLVIKLQTDRKKYLPIRFSKCSF
jgi:UDP-2,3-diacylglucosamine hydrolase